MIKIIKKELGLLNNPALLELPGAPDGGTSGILVFGVVKQEPLAFVKIFRDKDDNRLNKEATVLDLLADNRGLIIENVPENLFTHCSKSASFLGQTVVPGESLVLKKDGNYFCEKDFERTLANVTNFLISLGKVGRNVSPSILNNQNLESSLTSVGEVDYIGDILLINQVLEHGDFVLHNLLIDNGTLGVIDWSDSNICGTPLFDYYNFVLNAMFRLRKASHYSDFVALFEFSFFEKNYFSSVIKKYAYFYLDALEIDRQAAKILFKLFIESYWAREEGKIKNANLIGCVPAYLNKLNHGGAKCDASRGIFGALREFTSRTELESIL
tara:strand:+ start:22509 stop:23489 length:981 start_codon:yes stop_codon:yes gene_type:complete